MYDKSLRKVQLVQLEIAKEVKNICEKNNINYFLDSGTMLGAVRHGGFIPWDDDLDIGMLRKDYDKFLSIAQKELGEKYFLQNWMTDDDFPFSFSKIRKNNTLYVEEGSKKASMHKGIFIDIFPYDIFPEDMEIRENQKRVLKKRKRELLMKNNFTPWNTQNGIKKVMFYFGYLPIRLKILFLSRKKLIKKCEEIIEFGNSENKYEYYYSQAGSGEYGKYIVKKECLDNLEYIKFEDTLFLGPSDFDKYLKGFYGDYMKLPPEKERYDRHKILELKFNND